MNGYELARSKDLHPHKTDMEIASNVRMLMRDDLIHEMVCTDSRDRIMWLSGQVQAQAEKLARVERALKNIRELLGDFQQRWNARESRVDKIAKEALND